MTPTADCLIIYNAQRGMCEVVHNGSLGEHLLQRKWS